MGYTVNGQGPSAGASISTASGANEIPVSTGAGTDYAATGAAGVRAAIAAAGASSGLLSALPASASEGDSYACTDTDDVFAWHNGAWRWPNGQAVETLPSAILWLRADAGVTHSSYAVSAWASQGSVAGVSATQSTGAAKPTLVPGAIGGRPALRFDGGDYMELAYNASLDPASALTIAYVCRSTTTSRVVIGRPYAATHTDPYFNWLIYHAYPATDVSFRVNASDVAVSNVAAAIPTANAWLAPAGYVYTLNGSARKLRRNGAQVGATQSGATITYTNNVGIRIGGNAVGGEGLVGDIAEVMLFNSVLSDASVALVERYFAAKYGFSLWGA